MKPGPVEYLAPKSLDEALAALVQHGSEAKLLAGGQSLVPMMNFRLARPGVLIDLNRLAELDYVRPAEDGGIAIGAMTRQRRLERDPAIAEAAPLLAEAAPLVAHPQIRNRGTLGGSLAHADPAAELPVVAVALEAQLKIRGSEGERRVGADEFFVGLLTTDLRSDEILVEVEFPPLPLRTGWSFQEIARRHGDYAQVGVATLVTLDDQGLCKRARLVYLSVGDVPVVARKAAALLENRKLTGEAIDEAAALVATEEVDPTGDIHATAAYKRHLTRVLTARALRRARERAINGADR